MSVVIPEPGVQQSLPLQIKMFIVFFFASSTRTEIKLEFFLNNLDKNLQRASTGFLCEMSVDRMSLDIIYKENHVSLANKWIVWCSKLRVTHLSKSLQNMAVQNELLNLLQAESEATVVYAAIVLSQVWQIALEINVQYFKSRNDLNFKYIYMYFIRTNTFEILSLQYVGH